MTKQTLIFKEKLEEFAKKHKNEIKQVGSYPPSCICKSHLVGFEFSC